MITPVEPDRRSAHPESLSRLALLESIYGWLWTANLVGGMGVLMGAPLMLAASDWMGFPLTEDTKLTLLLLSMVGGLPFLVAYEWLDPRHRAVHEQRLLVSARMDPRPPWLLLRSLNHEIGSKTPSRTALGGPRVFGGLGSYEAGNFSVVRILVNAIGDRGTLVVLKNSWSETQPEQGWIGGLLCLQEPDTQWFARFARLAAAARVIIIIPQSSEGLRSELSEVSSKYAGKALVWMQPSYTENWWGRRSANPGSVIASEWTEVQKQLREWGWNLPDYDPEGLLYVPNADFSVMRGRPLHGMDDSGTVRSAIAELLPHLQGGDGPLSEALA